MSALTLVTGPTVEPILIADARAFLRVEHTQEDAIIAGMITSARRWAERYTQRAFITQTWDYKIDVFPAVIEVPKPPLQSITAASFTYVDDDGNSTQVATSVYTVDTDSEPGRIYEAYNQTWPSQRLIPHAINVRFVAGYGADGSTVPDEILDAIKIWMRQYYDTRGEGMSVEVAEHMLDPYRMPPF